MELIIEEMQLIQSSSHVFISLSIFHYYTWLLTTGPAYENFSFNSEGVLHDVHRLNLEEPSCKTEIRERAIQFSNSVIF
jgi:hypothetical protein